MMQLEPTKHYLALDQAKTKCGFAFGSLGMEAPLSGVLQLPSVGRRHGVLMAHFRDWLATNIHVYHVEKVIYEVPFGGRDLETFAVVNKLLGVIELACEDAGIICCCATSHEWRKRFLGASQPPKRLFAGMTKGRAQRARRDTLKLAAMATCAYHGWKVETDDAAEACGLLDFLLALDFPEYRKRTEILWRCPDCMAPYPKDEPIKACRNCGQTKREAA